MSGGESVQKRYTGIYENGMVQTYQENRGSFLSYTIFDQPFEFPFGAGIGRWGMMSAYFPESGNWLHPALYAEIQPTGWIYDGGILMCLFYPAGLIVAMRYTYKVAVDRTQPLSEAAMILFVVQLLVSGLCFTGPVFNTYLGITFWLSTALLYGAHQTLEIENWQAAVMEEEALAEGSPEMVAQ